VTRLPIPRRLRIRGRVWRVEIVPEPPTIRGVPHAGTCDHRRRRIEVWRGLPRFEREVTFAHELGHALVGRPRPGQRSAEERVVERLAGPLREMLSQRGEALGV
jgi:hypothetical protein